MHLKRLWLSVLGSTLLSGMALADEAEKVTYDDHVLPILKQRCATCHNPDKKSGGFDVTSYTQLMQGGGSGASIEAGDASASYMIKLVEHQEEPTMPPDADPIPEMERLLLRKWVDGGVLENKGSKAAAPKKKKVSMAMDASPTERPAVVTIPGHLSLQPLVRTRATTAIPSMATSPWVPLVAVAGQKQVLLYDSITAELKGVIPFPEGQPQALRFSRNGSLLMVGGGRGGATGKVVIFNVRDGRRIAEVGEELDTVLAADISPGHDLVVLGGPQKMVRVYSTDSGKLLYETKKHTDWIYAAEFSPDGVLLATSDRNGGLLVWEAKTGREYLVLNGHTAAVTSLSWRGDSNILASGSEDGSIKLWEMENGGQVKSWGAHGGGVSAIEFTRDGRIVSNGRDRVVKLWDQNGAQQKAMEASVEQGTAVSYCDESDRIFAADWTGEIRIYQGADAKRLGNLNPNPERIEERLTAAEGQLGSFRAAYDPLAQAAATMTQQYVDLEAKYQQMVKSKGELEQGYAAKVALVEKYTGDIAIHNENFQKISQAVVKLEQAIPPLAEAQKQIGTATAAMEDAATQEIAKMLAQKLQEHQTMLETQKGEMAKLTAAMEAMKGELTKETQARDAIKAQLDPLVPMVQQTEPMVAEALKKKGEADAAAATAKGQLDGSAAAVERWKAELVFLTRLGELEADLKAREEANLKTLEQLGTLEAVAADWEKQKVALEGQVAKWTEEKGATEKEVVALDASYVDLTGKIQARVVELTTRQAVIAQLGKSIESSTAARDAAKASLDLMAGDAELTAAVAALQTALDGQAQKVKLLQEGFVAMSAEKDAWDKMAAETMATAVAKKQSVEQISKSIADAATQLKPIVAKWNESVATVVPVKQQAEAAEKGVEEALRAIAAHQGVVDSVPAEATAPVAAAAAN